MAGLVYLGFSIYLYQPYFKYFDNWKCLLVINSILAAAGCYLLSRRWVVSFWGSFFAGAIYGFGPFMLGLGKFHPTAGFLAASIGWLFLPAAFGPAGRWRWLRVPLALLPFAAIIGFFQLGGHYRLFAVPTQTKLCLEDLLGLVAGLASAKSGLNLIGFYHVPIACLIIGLAMLLKARRIGIIVILCLGLFLTFSPPFLNVSALIWLGIPSVICSVLIGQGADGLLRAGFADRKYILCAAIYSAAASIVTLLLATKYFQVFAGMGSGFAKLFLEEAKMYILAAILMAVIFFLVRAKLRCFWLRAAILCSAMAVDIFFSAISIADMIH